MAGIYLHIPFCKQACYYCDFHFSTNQQLRTEMVQGIASELLLQKEYLGEEPVETIYFGGGTPSLLTADELHILLDTIRSNYSVITHPEISLEANPDDLTPVKLKEIHALGINRLSIGIQSFDDELLKFLHRAHNAAMAHACILEAKKTGFKNISIDLIYGIPNEHDLQWEQDISKAIALSPEHISCYSLTIEEKTVFGRWHSSGKLKPAEDEVAAHHLEILMEKLGTAGYEHYEISNFSKPGFHSRHNSNYWKNVNYLGVGPSAHSFNGISRQFNIGNNSLYLKAIQQGVISFEKEELSTADKINEFILTSLRTMWGTDLKVLITRYGYDLLEQHERYITQLLEKGFVNVEADTLYLTQKGKLLADKISSDLFVTP